MLCEHRPAELLTNHTYLVLTKYVHSAAEHRAAAASLLLRLLKLSPREIAPPLHPAPAAAAASQLPSAHAHHGPSLAPYEQGAMGGLGVAGPPAQRLPGLEARGDLPVYRSPYIDRPVYGEVAAYAEADPRAEWPMAPLHALRPYVEWHAQHRGSAGHGLATSYHPHLPTP